MHPKSLDDDAIMRVMLIMLRIKINNAEYIWLASLNAMQIKIPIVVAYDAYLKATLLPPIVIER